MRACAGNNWFFVLFGFCCDDNGCAGACFRWYVARRRMKKSCARRSLDSCACTHKRDKRLFLNKHAKSEKYSVFSASLACRVGLSTLQIRYKAVPCTRHRRRADRKSLRKHLCCMYGASPPHAFALCATTYVYARCLRDSFYTMMTITLDC